MRILYLDCCAGISGDMLLAALLDAGASLEHLQQTIKGLSLSAHPSIEIQRTRKFGISASKVAIRIPEDKEARTLYVIEDLIRRSSLSSGVKDLSCRIFRRLGEAEAAIHGTTLDHIHFHEVGALDSIVDIVGCAVCIEALGIEKVYASALPTFHGYVDCSHGRLPLPAPATLSLLKGVPWKECGVEGELVTPTGAAILVSVAQSFGAMPAMSVHSIGYGAGEKDFPVPNVLRAVIGLAGAEVKSVEEEVVVMEANIDDMNPQLFEYAMEKLFEAGALDVFVQPILMKKSRPAYLLTALCDEAAFASCREIILRETSTIGIRYDRRKRVCLRRRVEVIDTDYGTIRIKYAEAEGSVYNAQPEYEDCKAAAKDYNVPLKFVYDAVRSTLKRRA